MIKFCESKKLWLRELFVLATFRYSAVQASSSSAYVAQLVNNKEVEQKVDTVIGSILLRKNWVLKFKKN